MNNSVTLLEIYDKLNDIVVTDSAWESINNSLNLMELNAKRKLMEFNDLRTSQLNSQYFKKSRNSKPTMVKQGPAKKVLKQKVKKHRRMPSDPRSESYDKTNYYKDYENDLLFMRHPTETSKDKI